MPDSNSSYLLVKFSRIQLEAVYLFFREDVMTTDQFLLQFIQTISNELSIPINGVDAVVKLLDAGNTIPFIARYRKEATGNLDELQIKTIQERCAYLRELHERKQVILSSIESQGKLTEPLKQEILNCQIKSELEDLYLPFKPKRRTRAMIAREKGLEPLALLILEQPLGMRLNDMVFPFLNSEKGVGDEELALSGAKDIVAEMIAEKAEIRSYLREVFFREGLLISKVRSEKAKESSKFEQYYDFKEPVRTIPSHRYLAIRRGEREEFLDFSIQIDPISTIKHLEQTMGLNPKSSLHSHLKEAIEDAYHRLLLPSIETDIRVDLKMASDKDAVSIFAENLRHLLLASPMGARSVIGIDPGVRTGCKCAVVDTTGKYLESTTIFLSQGEGAQQQAKKELKRLLDHHHPFAIAIGNGTAGRETEAWVRKTLKELDDRSTLVVSVNESGASIYSASDLAREEFPDLDITIRGAISIARRLQDPLAELVKIDPKSIGVGQYQHDVHQSLLQDELQYVVESCVNHVGVDLNTASYSLLTYVSGIGPTLARKIIKHRENEGPFISRDQLQKVPGFGPKTFEQAAGFLRIQGGKNPLDASAVHPERYPVVEQMAKELHLSLLELISHPKSVEKIDVSQYAKIVGEHTLADIIQELRKPGRDPRAVFDPPAFRDDVLTMEDLKIGMKLEGVVTNVTAFGAFVDIGVHQDGLIHLSELSDRFIKDPKEVVKTGDKIKVEVLQIDVPRRRISLTARLGQKREAPENHLREKGGAKVKSIPSNFNNNPFNSIDFFRN